MPGTPWSHNSSMWIAQALLALGVLPYAKPIAEIAREINHLRSAEGWKEPGGHSTIRGQFWAVTALHSIQEAFDPSVHTYQIDSAIASSELKEPYFVRINVHKKWSFAVPSVFYQATTYLLTLFSAIFFSGLHRLIPQRGEFLISIACFVAAYYLSRKRPSLFHRWLINLVGSIAVVLSFVGLIFGISVAQIYDFIKDIVRGGLN